MGKLTHTVKGPIASFCSADKANIESLKLHFLPVQEGSGDASPQNIRNIFGWTGCNLNKAKKNLFDYDENNVELNLTTTSGLTRGVYHTGIISDGRYISVSASLKDPKVQTKGNVSLFRRISEFKGIERHVLGIQRMHIIHCVHCRAGKSDRRRISNTLGPGYGTGKRF